MASNYRRVRTAKGVLLFEGLFGFRTPPKTIGAKGFSMGGDGRRLLFPCECVSGGPGGYSDPWANVTKHKLLPNGTKERILNLVAGEPKTISQLAEALELAVPSVHTHVNDLMKSELLRESEEWEKKYPTERYYEPNFPVFKAEECAEFRSLCDEMADEVIHSFPTRRSSDLNRKSVV